MNAEIRQQLYGGEISDYYKKTPLEQESPTVKSEYDEIFNVYKNSVLREDADIPPPPPAIIQKAEDSKLTFDDIFNFVKEHEGYRPHVYKDSLGIPTIGIGFNLTRPDARKIATQAGADYDAIVQGIDDLTDNQIKEIFKITLTIAYHDAKKWIPNFDGLPKNVKLAILDLSFNMGFNRLSGFTKTRSYILKGRFDLAANELLKSKWATQVGKRAKSVSSLLSS